MMAQLSTRRDRGLVAALALYGYGCGAAACGAELPADAAERAVADYFVGQGVVDRPGVRCGERLQPKPGHQVRCRVLDTDPPVDVEVVVGSTPTDVTVRPLRPTLVVARIEPEIREGLRAQGRAVETIDCAGAVWAVHAGAEHRCRLRGADGSASVWIGTFSGQGSRHRARVVPATEAAGDQR